MRQIAGAEQRAVGCDHAANMVLREPLEEGQCPQGGLEVGLDRKGYPQWQGQFYCHICIDLKERRVEVHKVVAVDMVRQPSGQAYESLDLSGVLCPKLLERYCLRPGPQCVLIEEEAAPIHQTRDGFSRENRAPGAEYQV